MAASLFTDSYRPTFTRSVVVEGDFRSLVTGEACDLWRANALVTDRDPVTFARQVSLRIEYLLDEGSPKLCFDWELRLEDLDGRQLARVEAAEEIVARPDDKKAAYDVGGPTVRGSVNGRVRSFAALWNELRRFLPASITQQLAGINVLGPWVAESLARTWAWLDGHGAFDAPVEVLAPAWEQAAEEIKTDGGGWVFQSQQSWDDFLKDHITAAGLLEIEDGALDHARQSLLRLLGPLAQPYGVIIGQFGEFFIRDDADEDTARTVCRRALTTDVVVKAIHNSITQSESPLCCFLHTWMPGACSTHTPPENGVATLPPVEAPEPHDVRKILDGMDSMPGGSHRFADVWRSITTRHAENVSCLSIAPVSNSNDWLVRWASQGGYTSDRHWVVEFRLTPTDRHSGDSPLSATSMIIRTSSRDGSGRHVLPEIKDTRLVEEAFRRRLIAEGENHLACRAYIEGRENEVWQGRGGELHTTCTPEEALTRGLELLHTLTPARPVDGCQIPVQHPEPITDDDYEADEEE